MPLLTNSKQQDESTYLSGFDKWRPQVAQQVPKLPSTERDDFLIPSNQEIIH